MQRWEEERKRGVYSGSQVSYPKALYNGYDNKQSFFINSDINIF